MSLTCSLHKANRAKADQSGQIAWLSIYSDDGHITIFMPFEKAQAMADLFNGADRLAAMPENLLAKPVAL